MQGSGGYQLKSAVISGLSIFCGYAVAACNGGGQAGLAKAYGASDWDAFNTGGVAALSSGAFQAAGSLGGGSYWAHAAAGCVSAAAGGGNCGQGAVAAVFGKFATNATESWGTGVAQFAATVVAGGVGSVIGGGKFENGAKTAAYGYLFNQLSRGAGSRGLNSAPVNDPLDPETLDRRTNRGFVALDRLITRTDDAGPQEYQYALVAQRDGMYPNVRTPGIDMHLNAGDTWKIGTSIDPDHRYTQSYLNSLNVRMVPETTGSTFQVLVQEKIRLLGYMLTNFNLPPGNKILK